MRECKFKFKFKKVRKVKFKFKKVKRFKFKKLRVALLELEPACGKQAYT